MLVLLFVNHVHLGLGHHCSLAPLCGILVCREGAIRSKELLQLGWSWSIQSFFKHVHLVVVITFLRQCFVVLVLLFVVCVCLNLNHHYHGVLFHFMGLNVVERGINKACETPTTQSHNCYSLLLKWTHSPCALHHLLLAMLALLFVVHLCLGLGCHYCGVLLPFVRFWWIGKG